MTLIGARHFASLLRNGPAYVQPVRLRSSSCTINAERSNGKAVWMRAAAIAGFSAAGLWLYFNQVHCKSPSRVARPPSAPTKPFKAITLYQYQFSPYCSKARTFMEYYDIPYEEVEVNPLWKRPIKPFSSNRIPVAEIDGEKMDDSSLIISVLHTCMLTGRSIRDVLHYYPEMAVVDSKGRSVSERVNKYVVMYSDVPDPHQMVRRREEREWREWADSSLVLVVVPTMFRTLGESLRSFDYAEEISSFNSFERLAVKYIGGVAMYFVGKYMRRKHHLSSDVRRDLYQCCRQWVSAVGSHGTFMGGDSPCLADLDVYGVLRTLEGLDVFADLVSSTEIGPWYQAMKEQVQRHNGRL